MLPREDILRVLVAGGQPRNEVQQHVELDLRGYHARSGPRDNARARRRSCPRSAATPPGPPPLRDSAVRCSSGKSSPTTPTIRTGAKTEAASGEVRRRPAQDPIDAAVRGSRWNRRPWSPLPEHSWSQTSRKRRPSTLLRRAEGRVWNPPLQQPCASPRPKPGQGAPRSKAVRFPCTFRDICLSAAPASSGQPRGSRSGP